MVWEPGPLCGQTGREGALQRAGQGSQGSQPSTQVRTYGAISICVMSRTCYDVACSRRAGRRCACAGRLLLPEKWLDLRHGCLEYSVLGCG